MAATNNPESSRLNRWPRDPRHAVIAALVLWIVPMIVIGVMVALQPKRRTVMPLYHEAAANWWAGHDLYKGPLGMNYLPHFAVLFTPFHLLPERICDVLWRYCAAAMLAGGLWRIVRRQFGSAPERPFFWATLIAMPLCMNALRNGQANATFAGVLLLAIAALLERRWWLATGLMVLAMAVKPLGVVLLLLAPFVYAPLRWRLPIGLLGFVVFPFLFASPNYVIAQHRAALVNLQSCAVVTENRFADINGILRTLRAPLPPEASKIVRVLAGGLTLALWWLGARRVDEPLRGLWLYALTTAYLMLFNPMNEENSYVILAPALAVWSVTFLFDPVCAAKRSFGWCIAAMAWTMALLPNPLWPLFRNKFALFWHPLMTICFIAVLVAFLWRARMSSQKQVQSLGV
jgi:hypothetical protein